MKLKICSIVVLTAIGCMTKAISLPASLQTVTNKAMVQWDKLTSKQPTPKFKKRPNPKLDQEVLEQTVAFLSNDPNYKEKPKEQKGFLDRLQLTLDITDKQKEDILNMIKQRELRTRATRL